MPVTEVTSELLVGDLQVSAVDTEVVQFLNVSFGDVTSNHPENWVFVVVHCTSHPGIKPLVLEGVRVKARKSQLADL